MKSIVIAFPKKEIALSIKKVLGQSGYPVTNVCTTGAQALSSLNGLEDGVLVCGYQFVDMMYEEIYEYLPEGFQSKGENFNEMLYAKKNIRYCKRQKKF